MENKDLTVHACEQVLRFTSVARWEDLSEERKVQLGFNMGLMAMGLGLSNEDGYMVLWKVREGVVSMEEMREHVKRIVVARGVEVSAVMVARPF